MSDNGIALFERLAYFPSGEIWKGKSASVQASVRDELSRLLNSRRQHSAYTFPATVLDYGIADWSCLNTNSSEDRLCLIDAIQTTIRNFEPRLQQLNIDIQPSMQQKGGWQIRIDGVIVAHPVVEPVVFVAKITEGIDISVEKVKQEE